VEFACGPSGALGGVPVEIEEASACWTGSMCVDAWPWRNQLWLST
jgi:hypothetical protein